jgi:hypothetical protein
MKDSVTRARTHEGGAEDVARSGKPIMYVMFVVRPDELSLHSSKRRISVGLQI